MPGTQISFRERRGVAGRRASRSSARAQATTKAGSRPTPTDAGASFVPSSRSRAGETVTVTTQVEGAGRRRRQVPLPDRAAGEADRPRQAVARQGVPGGTQQFRSRPDLTPAAVAVASDSAPQADGDIFVAPQNGPSAGRPDDPRPEGQARLVSRHAGWTSSCSPPTSASQSSTAARCSPGGRATPTGAAAAASG